MSMYQKIKNCETKTAQIGTMTITKIRNIETDQVIVAGFYMHVAVMIDAKENVLNWYAGTQAASEYLKYVGIAVVQTEKIKKLKEEVPDDIIETANKFYWEALNI